MDDLMRHFNVTIAKLSPKEMIQNFWGFFFFVVGFAGLADSVVGKSVKPIRLLKKRETDIS